jgi:hypothetical protein
MGGTGDRIDRAERYVLGLMDDDERERAEHDLETDQAFREAMVEMAERMHVFDRKPGGKAVGGVHGDEWRLIKERLEGMPQMRPAETERPAATAEPQVTFGRRRSDSLRHAMAPDLPARTVGTGLHATSGKRAPVLALWLIAAFALGYATGVLSGRFTAMP